MSGCEEQYEKVCRGEFAELHAKLDKLDEAVRGNGRPGIQLRLDRLEQDAKRQSRLVWMLLGTVITGGASLLIRWMAG